MSPVDRKSLKARMKAAKEEARASVKGIIYPLPDLKGPKGNAFVLLAEAESLMRQNGISDDIRGDFKAEATSGDYENVLATIQKWFTVAVAEVTYQALPDDIDIRTLRPLTTDEEDEQDADDDGDEEQVTTDADIDSAMGNYAEEVERQRREQEIADRLTAELRAEYGLGPDDMIVVQIRRGKK